METQQLLDALTAHLALYHRRSSPARSPNPNPRKAILRWFSEIPLQQRRASLTVVDGAFVRVLLQMRERTRARGHGFFFLLPDVPSAADASLPALCFRRSRGLLARSSAASAWEGDVREGLLLFGSREGEGCECLLDSATVTEDFAGDVERFVEAMDGASDGRFLCGEVDGLNSAWFELDWLKDKGYYSMEAFVANRLEVALRMSWLNSKGGKKQKGGKSREKVNGLAAAAASAAAGVFWRKKGCLDWFLGLDPGARKKMITTFLGKGAKSMAKEISRCLGLVDDKISSLKGDLDHSGSYYSSTNSYIRQHSSYCRQYHLYCDWEFPVSLATRSSSIRASPFCTQLVELLVLQHIYTIFLAYQTNELEADHLWYSTLGSVETIFDNILLRFRGLLTVIARESMERELVENVHIALPSANISKEKVAVDIRGKKKCRNPKGSNSNSEPLGAVFSFKNPCMAERSESGLKMGRHTQKAREETEFANISKIKDVSESNKDLFMNIVGNTIADNRRTPSSRKKSKRKGATCKRSFCNGTGNAEMMSTAVMTDTMSPAIVQNEDLELIIENALPNAVSDVTIVGDNLQLEASSVDHLSFIVSAKAYNENSLDHFSYFTDESNISDRDSHKSRQAESGIPGVDVEIPSSSHSQSNTSCCGSIDGDSVRPILKKTSDDMNSSVLRKLEFVALSAKSGDNSKVDLGSRILASEKDSINGMNSSVVQKVEPFSNADEPEDNSVVPFSIADKDNSNKEFHSSGLTSVIDPSVKPVSEHKLCKDVINDSSSMISVGGKSNEWPNINPVNLSHPNSNNLPAATDRYHLDVTYNCPNNFQPLYYAGRHIRTPCIDHGRGQMMPSLNPSASLDWPPMVKTSRLSQSVALGYDSVYNTRLQSSLCTGINNIGMQFRGASGDSELHYPGDGAGLPDYKKTFDFVDDTESSWLSEDEYDIRTTNGRDYNKFFGGGVMYWNPSDPVGTSFSRAPSHSSEDSLWAWYEADLNRAIDDMIDMPGFPPSYGASGLASPTAGKFGSSFDGIGPGSQAHTHAPVISSIEVNNKALDSQCPTAEVLDEKASGSKSAISGTVEGLKGDSLPHPILRPIVIPTSSRKGSRSELKYSHDHVSPCLPSSRRDLPRIKRPPSPVVLCVPHSPHVPPPSVNDSRKHRVFPVVRSGSSSPRNWGMRSWQKEESNPEVAQFCIDGPEVVWTSWGKKGISTNSAMQSIPSSLFQDRLIAISQLARDHDHPDVAFPLQPPETVNCPTRKSSLSMMHSFLQEEINSFCKQVGNKNQLKKPYINWAVNRVAKSLQVLWPRSRTSIFGSNATGLALPTSDVDLVVCLPPVRNLEPIKEAGILEGRNGIKETCLQHAARYLSNQEWVKNDSLKTIENTAIPLIMLVAEVPSDIALSEPNSIMENMVMISAFMGESGKVSCNGSSTLVNASLLSGSSSNGSTDAKTISLDISFKSPSHTGLQTTALVRELTEQFPASVPLALVLKQFLADRSLDRAYSGGLSSYCLVLLITRFLQHEHHIGRPLHENLGSLLMDFLYFFGNVFDPRQMRVSIQGSGLYMNRERGHSIDPIHIDDPLCPTNNVGRNCFRIHQCIKAFADAYSILESELSLFSVEAGPSAQQPVKLLPKIIPSIGLHSQGPLEIRDMD